MQPWAYLAPPSALEPFQAHETPRTNRWAFVALVSGIIAIVPVAVGAGITALVQIHRRDQTGTGLAIAGLAAAAGWTLIAVAVGVGLALGGGSSASIGRVAGARTTQVGACLIAPRDNDSVSTETDCAQGHDAEVYFTSELDARPWPGYQRIDELADDTCYEAFEDYVGQSYESSDYDYGYFLPDQAEWLDGEHRIVCAILAGDGDRSRGSVRD